MDLRSLLQSKKLSAEELCRFYLDRIEKLNPALNAVLTISPFALQKAQDIDKHFPSYKDRPLMGIPILLKDVFCVKNMKTTAGSKMLENFIAPYSAEVTKRLEEAGAIILGKCNQDEFAMGTSNENSAFGVVLNPWNKEYVPGGSSGGSAAAVSAGLCAASIGTDTGGSIRQPASFCNLIGVKPTYGRVSRYGMIAYASSLDQAGPMTMYVEDSALILEILAGKDSKDSTSAQTDVPKWFSNRGSANIKKLKVGFLNKTDAESFCSPEVMQILEQVASLLQSHGATVEEVSLPLMDMAVPVYYLISTSEASSNLARYDGIRYGSRFDFKNKTPGSLEEFYSQNRGFGFGKEVKRRIIMGTYCLSSGYYDEYYNKASQIRRKMRESFIKTFSEFSLLLSPVSLSTAFKLGEKPVGSLASYLVDNFTVSANLAGLPSLSVPAGFSSKKSLPIGVQLIGNHFDEQTLFDIALLIQEEIKAVGKRPTI
ncbi:MAG: Asp-tRNA(Asn)/Glu-tRNA(Gln) amidotransferase subunit GatA [Oligoflexia bacterium]|nr:Asp-tRNA(Asn)/Glu-tRNA(Gln) amidotransferase subunit GatA [Oligoflexia bacterium]